MKKVLILIFVFVLIISNIFYTIYAVSITDNSLNKSIKNINSFLKKDIDPTDLSCLTEVVDENNNVPAYEYYPTHIASRAIRTLKAHDGKIFMGIGDWDENTGPVTMLYYDTEDGKVKSSGTISDEAVQNFTIIDDKLYTTGCDPRDDWGEGSYYIYNKQEDKWDKHLKKDGWIHVYNIVEFKDKLFMCGSTVDTTKTSTIQASSDNGETFKSVNVKKDGEMLPYDSGLRCYNLAVVNDKLYGYINNDKYTGLYEYDEEKNEFNHISTLPSPFGSTLDMALLNGYSKMYLRYVVFENYFIYVSGTYLYKSTDLKSFTEFGFDVQGYVQDAVVYDKTLYTLHHSSNSDGTYTARIYKSSDLEKFDLVYEFKTETQPFSLEYYDNSFYVGTGYNYNMTINPEYVNKNGSFYRINLDKATKSLKLNKDDKLIEISDRGNTYDVKYNLSKGNPTFKINLNFNNKMDEKEWKQEYDKLNNLKLVFATIADVQGAEIDKSTAYFDEALSKNSTTSNEKYSSAIDYAKDMFTKDLDIKDNLFTLTSKNNSKSENEYKTEITLTVNNEGDFSSLKSSDNNSNNNTNTESDSINNSVEDKDKTDKENQNNNKNNSKLPQAGKFFELKNLLQIIIFVSIIFIVYLVRKERKA